MVKCFVDWRRSKERALFSLKDWRMEFDLIVFLSKKLIFSGRDFEGLAFASDCCRLCLLASSGKSIED